MRDSLIISVEGKEPTARILSLLEGCRCPCPTPARRLSITFSEFPKGSSITMSTSSTATLSIGVSQEALGHIDYTDSPDPVLGLTAVSDNAAIIVTQSDDTSFFVGGDGSTEATGNVTFTDSDGNTIVVTVTTSAVVPPVTKTLGITFDAPVSL